MKVLIVDDNALDRKLLYYTLKRHGCTVIEARDGEEGLNLARRRRPDIIVSDALMPRMDGFQLLRAVKADANLEQIPFVFYSATYIGEQEEKLALSLGAEAFLVKPKEPEELWAKTSAIIKAGKDRKEGTPHAHLIESEEEYLRGYSRVVATQLENKVAELEEALAMREKAEQELRTLNAELQARVNREVEKSRAKDSIVMHQARLAAMGEMLGNIAHQWRQPLNNIALIVQSIQVEFESGGLNQSKCREEVDRCVKLLTYLSSTIDNFCSFYQPDRDRKPFNLSHAVAEAVTVVKEELRFHGINIKLEAERGLTINGFEREFSQVLQGIIQNAKEAILSRKPPDPFIEIVCRRKGNSALITVNDNGGGIPPEVMEKIFDPYFTTKFKSQGVGMGLYIAEMIIEKHMGGRLFARNSAIGAELAIEIPLEGAPCREVA